MDFFIRGVFNFEQQNLQGMGRVFTKFVKIKFIYTLKGLINFYCLRFFAHIPGKNPLKRKRF